jgi:Xaa-Pro aminopeptidase
MPSSLANRRWARVDHRGADAEGNLLDKVAFDYVNTHGKDLHGEALGKYFIHTLGHSVGIDVHDPYDYDKPFEIGSVFTIEPGIYIPEEKIGCAHRRYVLCRLYGQAHQLRGKAAAYA